MQPALWYWRRLKAMQPAELLWRMRCSTRDMMDHCAFALSRNGTSRTSGPLTSTSRLLPFAGRLLAHLPSDPATVRAELDGNAQFAGLIEYADQVLRNQLSIFDLEAHDLGPTVDWNYEYALGQRAPMGFAPRIDYRDLSVAGDAKVIWEPNRHQHLPVLGRAYLATGDGRYAAKVVEQIESWIEQCPYRSGMNWRSPLELAIRLINWVWAIDMISSSGAMTSSFTERLLTSVHQHVREIAGKYSKFSSANNHLVGEAAGVFIAASYFASLDKASALAAESGEILNREIELQNYADGGNREQALGYHQFVLEFFLLAGVAGRRLGTEFPTRYWNRLEQMVEYLAAFQEGGENLPLYGDSDDGYVLDLGARGARGRGLLGVGGKLFGRSDFTALARTETEPAFWLLDETKADHSTAGGNGKPASSNGRRPALRSRALRDSGYYLLQSGHLEARDRISVTFDCGELGFGSLAAHGHADALSVTLRAFGEDILVDPGTYDYFTDQRWRRYFRSTAAHNTVVVDGQDQSEMLGPFLWGCRAEARCLEWRPTDEGGVVRGEHDGYRRLQDPVVHRREVALTGGESRLIIRDELEGASGHHAAFFWHFAEHCTVSQTAPGEFLIDCNGGRLRMTVDPHLTVTLFEGSEEPISGWVSRGYHRKSRAVTLMGECDWRGSLKVETQITIEAMRSKGIVGPA